mgnify:CR=1 FL=1
MTTWPAGWNLTQAPADIEGLRLRNAQVLGSDGQFRQGSVSIVDGAFAAEEQPGGIARVDASHLWLTPGFVDAVRATELLASGDWLERN